MGETLLEFTNPYIHVSTVSTDVDTWAFVSPPRPACSITKTSGAAAVGTIEVDEVSLPADIGGS